MSVSDLGVFPLALMAGAVLLGGGIMAGPAEPALPSLSELTLEAAEDSLSPAESAIPLANAPSCATTALDDSGWTDHLTVRNGCSHDVRLKVVLAHGTDLPCYTYGPGQSRSFSRGYPKRVDRLVTC
jgi:hypothetical protein